MKANKLTPGQNIAWESSRMMLPEHKEALRHQKSESKKKCKPEVDEQMLRLIAYAIEEAYVLQSTVKVIVFGEFEDIEHIGVITRVDRQHREIKLDQGDDYVLIKCDQIVFID